jgi:hypothetical protein
MITLYKGITGNTLTTTFYERLNYYGLSGATGQTYYFKLRNDLRGLGEDFHMKDKSPNPWRYNLFQIESGIPDDIVTGLYSYSGYADSSFTQLLEVGKLLISGANASDSVYW